MAESASDYHRGDQDIRAQQATFRMVMTRTKWASLVIAVAVLFLTLWFCTGAGFFNALISAVVLAGLGFVVLRSGPAQSH